MRFVDADAANIWLNTEACEQIKHMPTADVAPVRWGHWVKVGDGTTCSECMRGIRRVSGKQSEWVDLSGMLYCPNCGAKMEGENHDD